MRVNVDNLGLCCHVHVIEALINSLVGKIF